MSDADICLQIPGFPSPREAALHSAGNDNWFWFVPLEARVRRGRPKKNRAVRRRSSGALPPWSRRAWRVGRRPNGQPQTTSHLPPRSQRNRILPGRHFATDAREPASRPVCAHARFHMAISIVW